MKKFLLASLLLSAGLSGAFAQSFEVYVATENPTGKEFDEVYTKVESGATVEVTDYELTDYGAIAQAELMLYPVIVNLSDDDMSVSCGYDVINFESSTDVFGIQTCFGGSCVAQNPFSFKVAAGSETPGGFAEHLGYSAMTEMDILEKATIDATLKFTFIGGPDAFILNVHYKHPADSSVDGIASENAPVEYFNLQGMKVTETNPGQIYIKRQGSKVSKVVL